MTNNLKNIFNQMVTDRGNTIAELSNQSPVMLVFLRHFGCTFCRDALAELSHRRTTINKMGSHLVFVHMSNEDTANNYFRRYNLEGVEHVSDPTCQYYTSFGLLKGNFRQLFGLSTWIKGFQKGIIEGQGLGKQLGDDFQMPGVFIVQGGNVREHYIHKLASDKPDYEKMAECCII